MKFHNKNIKLDSVLPKILVASIVFYFYKVTFWPITYLFIITYVIFLALFFIRNDWKFRLSLFISEFLPPLILAAIFLILALINNILKHPIQQKDLLLIAVLFSFFYFLFWITFFLKQEIPKKFTVNMIVYTALIVCCLNILNSISVFKIPVEFLYNLHISDGNTIADDYNFYCLYIILGLIALNYRLEENISEGRYSKIETIVIRFIFIINILLSGSRRGIIVFIVLILSFFILDIVKDKSTSVVQKILKNSLKLIIFIIFLVLFGIFIIRKMPHTKISVIAYRYSSIIGINDFEYVNRELWIQKNKIPTKIDSTLFKKTHFISQNYWTSSGNGARIKEDLAGGIRVRIKNKKSEDLKLCFDMPAIIYFANHTYSISFNMKVFKGDCNSINSGWWSDDGNMGVQQTFASCVIDSLEDSSYHFNSKYTFIDNHIGIGLFLGNFMSNSEFNISDFEITDLDFDPTFQKLKFESKNENEVINWLNKINPPINNGANLINNGDFKYGLNFWKASADSLTLSVKNSDTENYLKISRADGNGGYFSLFYTGRKIYFYKDCEYQLSFKLKTIDPQTIPFFVGFWLNEGDGYLNNLPLKIDTLKKGWLLVKSNYKFKNTVSNLVFPINSQIDNSEFLITDINLVNLTQSQYNLEPQLQVIDSMQATLISGRVSRLRYAAELWKTEYKWYNKLFGHGFNYFEWFGKKFLNDPLRGDYPHNPLISILLYSGILGLIIYLWLLYKVISLYIYYRKEFGFLFLCFIITFFFSFFSGNNPFDPSVIGFFVILPFFINMLHENKD